MKYYGKKKRRKGKKEKGRLSALHLMKMITTV